MHVIVGQKHTMLLQSCGWNHNFETIGTLKQIWAWREELQEDRMIDWNVTSPLEDELISENNNIFLPWWRPWRQLRFALSFPSIKAVLLQQNTSEIFRLSTILHHITLYVSATLPWKQSHMWKQTLFKIPLLSSAWGFFLCLQRFCAVFWVLKCQYYSYNISNMWASLTK